VHGLQMLVMGRHEHPTSVEMVVYSRRWAQHSAGTPVCGAGSPGGVSVCAAMPAVGQPGAEVGSSGSGLGRGGGKAACPACRCRQNAEHCAV